MAISTERIFKFGDHEDQNGVSDEGKPIYNIGDDIGGRPIYTIWPDG